MNHSQSSSVGRPQWDAARSRTVFFAHQSVGENILDGLRQIAATEGYPAMTVVETGAAAAAGPALWHEKVGQNGDPMSKINGFTQALNAGAGARADVALMKFCFWDIQKDTDVKAVFSAYKDAMTQVSRQFPNLTLVHTTVPLVVEDSDWKASVRRLLRMAVPTDLDNAAREELNRMIRQEYGSRAALFDIAALEQQTPGHNGVPYLAAAYSSDGAHLNDAGRRVVAAGLVKSLAAVRSRVDAGTRLSAPMQDSRIHVMQATFGMSIGGMERVIADLCRYVDPERYRFTVCCLSVRGPLADEVEADGIPVIYCANQTRFGKYMRGFELGRLLRRERVDILHTHNTTAFIDGLIGARLAGVPIMVHTDHCKNYPIERRWMMAENVASRLIDKVVAVSNHTREELLHYEGLAPDKVTVIHNGINPRPPIGPAGIAALRREFGFAPDQFVVGTVGRLEPQKGLDLLLESVPVVAATHPGARVMIVGGGSLEAELKEQARALGILDRVIFTGWRTDAVALMEMFDCFVQTSNFEGLPMVLLEAMSLAKPIIACSVGGVPEVVEHEYTGLTVHTRAADDFGRAVARLITDRELTARFGRQARARYEERFTAQAMASRYQQLYEQFLDEKKVQAA